VESNLAAAAPAWLAGGGERQAMVLIDGGEAAGPLPRGWSWTLANARLADLMERYLASAGISWSATLLPDSHRQDFIESVGTRQRQGLSTYAGSSSMRLKVDELFGPASGEEPVLLVFGGRQFPACDLRQALEAHRSSRCDVTFIGLCEPRNRAPYDEQLQVGTDGYVERVRRMYGDFAAHLPAAADARHWPALVLMTPAAAQRLAAFELPVKLPAWPPVMLLAGLRCQGISLAGKSFDLDDRQEQGALAAELLRAQPQWLADAGRLTERPGRLYVGREVIIDPSAQIIGPVAIGDAAEIGAGAVVVGPVTIGCGARIQPGAIVRHGAVEPGAVVRPVAALRTEVGLPPAESQRLVSRVLDGPGASHGRARRGPSGHERQIRLQTVIEAAGRSTPLASLRHRAYRFMKRALDLLGASLFILLSAPLLPLIALAIKINSPGPIFYGHLRQGLGGRPFKCWKFRTMVPNAERLKRELIQQNEVDGPQFKIKDDPRIFLVGRILRRLNIDEWPQFWNVLVGDMSLVGPRPSPEHENQMCPAWREARLSVRPGITGLWQVSRQREEETDFQEWIYYDVQYVKRQSIWLDLVILLRTFRVALSGS
jgi:lipopolysaccharide/colanic/teichoic acid biosynthesis glycosyltransferase